MKDRGQTQSTWMMFMDRTERKTRLPRKILFGWLLLELAALPVAAQVVDRVKFTIPERVIVADMAGTEAGVSSFLVASNTPFTVEVAAVVGDVEVEVFHTGHIGDMRYGSKAQMPGAPKACVKGRFGTVEAYRSERKTASIKGDVQDQAVRVNVRYDAVADPMITIGPATESMSSAGESCARLVG